MFILNPYRYSAPANLLLDTYSGAAAAYSLRKLKASYSASAIRVRRSDDNLEADIGFDANGNLNESSLSSWCGENLIKVSESIENNLWQKFNATATADQTNSPIGTLTADKIIANTTNNGHAVYQGTFTSTIPYTASIYAKKSEYSWIAISSDIGGSDLIAYFNLNDGTIGTVSSGLTAQISSSGNGFYRCSITRTTGSGAGSVAFWIAQSDNNKTFAGNNSDGVFMWGAQLNSSNSLKDYTYTSTSAISYPSGYVTKWYDQSGNSLDATMTTSAAQPRIVNAGNIEKVNNKPTIYFDGSNHYLSNTSLNINQPDTVFLVAKSLASNANKNVFDGITQRQAIYANASSYISFFASQTQSSTESWGTTNLKLISALFSGANSVLYSNGNSIKAANAGLSSFIGITLGSYPTGQSYFNCQLSEFFIYASDKSSNRASIESNINSYYSIY